jgi:pimeloyl-ACP methyl ester carboxylesterase
MDRNDLCVFTLPDDRRLAYAEYGVTDGMPVVYCHGFPSSRLEVRIAHAAAVQARLRLIAPDRPGFGRSDPSPGRRLVDWPDDVAALLQHLAIERYAALGVSGGAPYALACAARHPQQMSEVTLVAGLGPIHEPALARGLPWHGRLARSLVLHSPALARLFFALLVLGLRCAAPALLEFFVRYLSPADQAALADAAVREALLVSFREAARQGAHGWAKDFAIYARPWGFTLSEVRVPVHLWHGNQDKIVAPAIAQHLASVLPHCHTHFLPGEGHYSLPLRHMHDILGALVSTESPLRAQGNAPLMIDPA